MNITLADFRAAAEHLANAHNDTAGAAALLNAEIKNAIAPILEKYKPTIDAYANAEAAARTLLESMLLAAPHLFVKPRSLTVDGVRCGYIKAPDALAFAIDADEVIARIKVLRPDLAKLLIRTQESLILDALSGVDNKDLIGFGVRTITGVDEWFITIGDNDAEKLTRLVIAAAASRQGEEDAPKAKKGKTRAKVAA